jgi:hypothetical protein
MPRTAALRQTEDDEDPIWAQFLRPPADLHETLDDRSVVEQIGRIISSAMMKGPWTGC